MAKVDIHANDKASGEYFMNLMKLSALRAELSLAIASGNATNDDESKFEQVNSVLRDALAMVKPHVRQPRKRK